MDWDTITNSNSHLCIMLENTAAIHATSRGILVYVYVYTHRQMHVLDALTTGFTVLCTKTYIYV